MKNHAFTLIELLVVVLIIGILAAIALPQYQKAVLKSKFARLQPLVASLANAGEVYYLANGVYPSQFSELDVELPQEPTSSDTAPDESGSFTVNFPWGSCTLTNNASNKFIGCNDDSNISYTQFFIHSPRNSGDRVCSAKNGDTTAYAVCKSLTGHEPYYASADNNAFAF